MVVKKAWMAMATLVAFAALPACATSSGTTAATSTSTGEGPGGGEAGGGGATATGTGGHGGTGGQDVRCGDGEIATTEICDDGNTIDGDGCDATCNSEPGWNCAGVPSFCESKCGDGLLVGTETCDDGNTKKSDGCSSTCVVEQGYLCTGAPSVCASVCGDGLFAAKEQCDDGNTKTADGCSDTCQVEQGYSCIGQPSKCATGCGDGLVAGSEECDDHNFTNGDGCDNGCKIEPFWTCTGALSVCTTLCGDGHVLGAEACDDGNVVTGDGCGATCKAEPGYICTGDPSKCDTLCGDGVIVAGLEICDDGNTSNGDGCNAVCKVEPGFTCSSASPTVCKTICGDGYAAGDETCDVGAPKPNDGCDDACHAEHGYVCNNFPSVCSTVCGDGVVGGSEQCDDGNNVGGDGCSASCGVIQGYACAGEPSNCTTVCGDSIQAGVEQCDDGNNVNGDCCSTTCSAEPGCEVETNDAISMANSFAALAMNATVKGTIKPATDIDTYLVTIPAGQTAVLTAATLDGFNSSCVGLTQDSVVTVYDSNGSALGTDDNSGPGNCALLQIVNLQGGDYYVEVKAKGATPFSYALNVQVQLVICGDGVKSPGEQCDDSNTASGDGCSSTCVIEVVNEIEPNNTPAQALANGPFPAKQLWAGAISPVADNDYYLLQLPTYADLRTETFDGTGLGACTGIDTKIYLYAANGTTQLDSDDDSGVNSCSLMDSTVAANVGSRHLAPGNYFIRVQRYNDSVIIPAYEVLVTFNALCGNGITEGSEECDGGASCSANCTLIPLCGDGLIKSPETCDDGNLTSGDGCSATCAVEPNFSCSGVPSVCAGTETNCSDGLDNDGDGATDCADTECAGACALLTCPAGQSLYSFTATGLPTPIPDLGTATSSIAVPVNGTVKQAVLKLSITHGYDADVDIALRSPTVGYIDISSDNGSSSANYTNTVFNDTCATSITAGTAPFTGCYKPEAALSAFANQPANGTWTLTATDDAAIIAGTLNAWSLTLCVQ